MGISPGCRVGSARRWVISPRARSGSPRGRLLSTRRRGIPARPPLVPAGRRASPSARHGSGTWSKPISARGLPILPSRPGEAARRPGSAPSCPARARDGPGSPAGRPERSPSRAESPPRERDGATRLGVRRFRRRPAGGLLSPSDAARRDRPAGAGSERDRRDRVTKSAARGTCPRHGASSSHFFSCRYAAEGLKRTS